MGTASWFLGWADRHHVRRLAGRYARVSGASTASIGGSLSWFYRSHGPYRTHRTYDGKQPTTAARHAAQRVKFLVALPLQLHLQLLLEGLDVSRAGLVALLRRFEHQAALLVEGPLAANTIAESNGAADHRARAHDAVDFQAEGAGASGSLGGNAFVTGKFFRG